MMGTVKGSQMSSEIMNPEQVCVYLSVSDSTLKAWRKQGIGPPSFKMGSRLIRYKTKDVELWADTQASIAM